MKQTKILTSFFLTALLVSCGGTQNHNQELHEQEAKEEHHQESAEAKLSLNNGVKWAADKPTYDGMKAIKLALTQFSTVNSSANIEEFNTLGNQLGGITKEIIAKCSMKGPDHDQLHIVLAPMLENVDVIKNGTDVEMIRKNVDELEGSLAQFFTHFELK
ncbi:MAG: hypothetical protein L3J06_05030 [Cyclobacteriaceae bacterium]|nr:hypothetical protein [Cyclobacteriaceae bacterium]